MNHEITFAYLDPSSITTITEEYKQKSVRKRSNIYYNRNHRQQPMISEEDLYDDRTFSRNTLPKPPSSSSSSYPYHASSFQAVYNHIMPTSSTPLTTTRSLSASPPLTNYQQPAIRTVFRVETILSLVILTLWTGILVTLMIGKLVLGEDSVFQYFKHFTNWCWTVNALFFFIDFMAFFECTAFKRIRYYLAMAFWFVNGVSWLVFFLVIVVLFDNPHLLDKIALESDMSLGLVFFFELVFHKLPGILNIFYLYCRRYYFYTIMINYTKNQSISKWYIYTSITLFSPIVLLLIYMAIFDVEEVYGLVSPKVIMVMIGLGVLLLFNIIPFTIIYYSAHDFQSNYARKTIALFTTRPEQQQQQSPSKIIQQHAPAHQYY